MFLSSNKEYKLLLKKYEEHIFLEDKLLSLFENLNNVDNNLDNIEKLYEILQNLNKLRNNKFNIYKSSLMNKKEKVYEDIVKNCVNEVDNILNVLEKEEVATINLSSFINLKRNITAEKQLESNTLEPNILETNTLEKFNGKVLILSSDRNKNALQLKSGKKIILTNTNFDFSSFSYDELIEILRLFDVMICDHKYDNLRYEITKQISCISSFSLIK